MRVSDPISTRRTNAVLMLCMAVMCGCGGGGNQAQVASAAPSGGPAASATSPSPSTSAPQSSASSPSTSASSPSPSASSPSSPGLADLVVSGPITLGAEKTYRDVTIRPGGTLIALAGLSITGDLFVEAGGELQVVNQPLRISGDIVNDGAVYDMAGIIFGSKTGSNTVPQSVTNHAGKGVFRNAKTSANAHFTGLEVDNTAGPVAVTINLGDGLLVDGAVIVSSYVHFVNGILDIGPFNQFVFRANAVATRVNGALLRDQTGQMAKQFPAGASTFTYHIVDAVAPYQYTPVTVDLLANSFQGNTFSFNVGDARHPNMSDGGAPAHYLTRYWRAVATPIGTYHAKISFDYLAEDVVGTESLIGVMYWNGTVWVPYPSTRTGRRFTVDVNEASMTDGTITQVTGRTP